MNKCSQHNAEWEIRKTVRKTPKQTSSGDQDVPGTSHIPERHAYPLWSDSELLGAC